MTTTTTTTARILREDESGHRFIVAADRGAVECRTAPGGVPVVADYHSPRPWFPGDDGPQPCDLIPGGCWSEAGTGLGALREAWVKAGGDDEVIWAWLEDRYARWEAEAGQ